MAHVIWRQYRVCPVASGNHTARLPRSFTFSTNSASLRCTARAQHDSVLCPWRHSCLPPCMHPAGSIHSPRTALPSDSYKAACSQPSQASDSLVHSISHLTAIIAAFDSSGRNHSTKFPFHQAFRPSHRPLSSFFLHPNHRNLPYTTQRLAQNLTSPNKSPLFRTLHNVQPPTHELQAELLQEPQNHKVECFIQQDKWCIKEPARVSPSSHHGINFSDA